MSTEAIQPAPGATRRMLGRYELLSEIGSGAMGIVYVGRIQGGGGFERLFAIKVLHRHLAQKPQIVAMLRNEARLAAQIQHPNVVSTVDAELCDRGENFVVMEYVDGFTLCEVLDHPKLDAVRRVRLGLRILLDAMAGLDAAHRLCDPADGSALQIVHRDVSPSNVLVNLAGAGLIADFGIARASAFSVSTQPGALKGTPCYMAPEQATGSDDLDARADVFGLGAVLWEVLTGEQLFYSPAGIAGVLERVLTGKIEAPSCRNSRIPVMVDDVCLKALCREQAERYQSVRDLAEELERVGREQDLIASTHEVSEALSQLFAETIERRRAALAQVIEPLRDSDPNRVALRLQSQPVLAGESGSADVAPVALLPEAELRASSDGMFDRELAALRQSKPRWPWVALAAGVTALAAVGLSAPRNAWVHLPGMGDAGEPPAKPSLASVAAAGRDQAPAIIPAVIPVAEAATTSVAPTLEPSALQAVVDPAAAPEQAKVANGLLTATAAPPTARTRRASLRLARVETGARVRPRIANAPPPVAKDGSSATAMASNEGAGPMHASVLEKNPYLLQR